MILHTKLLRLEDPFVEGMKKYNVPMNRCQRSLSRLMSGTLLLLAVILTMWSPSGHHNSNLTEHADLRREIKLQLMMSLSV